MNNYEMVLCIVDAGFSELVMDAAKEEGAEVIPVCCGIEAEISELDGD